MLPFLIILAFGVLYARDGAPAGSELLGGVLSAWQTVIASVAPMFVLTGALWLAVLTLERGLERTGRVRRAMLAERLVAMSRPTATLLHVWNVLALDLTGAVRRIIGDLVLVDELLTLVPLLGVFAAGWWAIYPIERRMREVMILRRLDSGRPVYPLPSRARFVWVSMRTQVLFVFVPLAGMLAWTEGSLRLIAALPASWRADWREPSMLLASHIIGVAGMLLAMPLALRFLWDTVAMGESPLTARLRALCLQYGVRVRRLLMWRTDGVIVNGAVVGVLRPLRYILLTDALLDQLPTEQIEAVTAHEVGHVRLRHMVWLGVTVLACVFGVSVLTEVLLWGVIGLDPEGSTGSAVGLVMTLSVIFVAFGAVSRGFERQADAFAARHMSGALIGRSDGPTGEAIAGEGVFSAAGVACMAEALLNVAALNGIAPDRFTWRHGSITGRVEHLRSLEGKPLGRVRADRRAALLKRLSLVGLVLGVLVMILVAPVR